MSTCGVFFGAENEKLFYIMRCIKMYVNKKSTTISLKPGYIAKIQLVAYSVNSIGLRRLLVFAYRYPCGRIKLVCPAASNVFVDRSFFGRDVVFDSVSSLYSVPGVHIYTNPETVYALLDMKPYACK